MSPDAPRGVRLAALAAAQHGVVGCWQLGELGYSTTEVTRARRAGRLHRLYRGVYAVGHRQLSRHGRWMAAVLACGQHAVLSHRTAAALWQLRPAGGTKLDVTSPGRSHRAIAGVRHHAARTLHPQDVTVREGLPVTTVERMLLDEAEVLTDAWLLRLLETAEGRELIDGRALQATIERNRGRHGIRPLRAAIARLTGSVPWTRSELENAFLALIREAALPEPKCNVLVHGILIDFFWPDPPLAVELDGLEWHRDRGRFEADRRTGNVLQVHGIPLLRFTQPRLEHQPEAVLREVSALLARDAAAAGGR